MTTVCRRTAPAARRIRLTVNRPDMRLAAAAREGDSVQAVLLYCGSIVIFSWGVGHLIPTRSVVAGFGQISRDNTRIITMEWILEGLTLCFLGVLVALAALVIGSGEPATRLVARAAGGMLLVMATVSVFTGARTAVLPMKLCPVVKSVVAAAWLTAAFL